MLFRLLYKTLPNLEAVQPVNILENIIDVKARSFIPLLSLWSISLKSGFSENRTETFFSVAAKLNLIIHHY